MTWHGATVLAEVMGIKPFPGSCSGTMLSRLAPCLAGQGECGHRGTQDADPASSMASLWIHLEPGSTGVRASSFAAVHFFPA